VGEENNNEDLLQYVNSKVERLKEATREINSVVLGQEDLIDKVLITMMCGGHVLLEGPPGGGKTLLVNTTARVMGLTSGRVQCTPDLMPADILGSEVMDETPDGKKEFRFIEGPVFSQFLLVDEINRASPRTQSALLQAMQEKSTTIAGKAHDLPNPFHVLATQNPIEQEGTYPLPEAQLDRFLMKLNVPELSADAEREMAIATTKGDGSTTNKFNISAEQQEKTDAPTKKYEENARQILEAGELLEVQALVRDMVVPDPVIDAIVKLVRSGRPGNENAPEVVKEHVLWEPGSRATQAMMLAVRARALLQGRLAPSVDDVVALAEPILQHRMSLGFQARSQGITVQNVIQQLTKDM
jgi:MoxR-like ATPase